MASSLKFLLFMLLFIFIQSDYELSNDFIIPETAHQISFVVKANTYFSIRLKGNSTTGYIWILINGHSSSEIAPMNLTKDYSGLFNQEKEHSINGGTFQFIFQAKAASNKKYPLIFSYRRPWEDEIHNSVKLTTVYIKIVK